MTLPRRIMHNATVMVTRRTLRRTHLLRPDANVNNLFLYVLAVLCARHGIAMHAFTIMSTHEHLVLTDVNGCLPRFLQELHRLLALGIKVLRDWEGPVWDHEKTSIVELATPQAIMEKTAYVMANPVAAGLVEHAHQWPGLKTLPKDLGSRSWTARRPDYFFDPNNPDWPEEATLHLTEPPHDHTTCAAFRECVADELKELERGAHVQLRHERRRFWGAAKLLKMSPFARATTQEPARSRNPTFAVGRGNAKALFECIASLRTFRMQYCEALARWRERRHGVAFPPGTWWMHVFHAVAVRDTDEPARAWPRPA